MIEARTYPRVAKEVLRACQELVLELELNGEDPDLRSVPSFRLVPGDCRTCYGIVRSFDRDPRITLVVGRLLTTLGDEAGVELQRVPIEGARVIEVLTQAQRDQQEHRFVCSCGHDLPLDPSHYPKNDDYVCPACRFRPFRPKDWRG